MAQGNSFRFHNLSYEYLILVYTNFSKFGSWSCMGRFGQNPGTEPVESVIVAVCLFQRVDGIYTVYIGDRVPFMPATDEYILYLHTCM